MFGDYSRDLLRSGILEAKAGNRGAARKYLDRALYMSSDHDVMAEAWFWMSQISDEAREKRNALENCLANDLHHARARRALAILDGKLKPEEVVNPDALPPAPPGQRQAEAGRFMCPRCGGRMNYSPSGSALVCEYCRRNQALASSPRRTQEEDFILAMATRRGHSRPLREQALHCDGCGAEFILPSRQLSFTCAYCGSPHVVRVERSDDLIAPDRILLHTLDQGHAADVLRDWSDGLRMEPEPALAPPRGLYLPAWTFSLGGGIDYIGEMPADDGARYGAGVPQRQRISDRYPVMLSVSIAASRKPSAPFVRLLASFDLQAAQPYSPALLAAWPAELNDVSMAEASLEARSQAYTLLKRDLPSRLGAMELVSTSSANLTIESFSLDLLPVWISELRSEGRGHMVLVNGQSGAVESAIPVASEKAKGGLMAWLADLVGE